MRAEALTSISENYESLQATWEAAKQATKDTEMKARIIGVASQMEKFDYFGVELGRKCLNMVDNLSRSLQKTTMSACEGQEVVKRTIQSLQSIRSGEQFDLFWKYVQNKCSRVDISSPKLPCRERPPPRFETGKAVPEYPKTVEDYFRSIYFEVIDLLMGTIENRFKQKGYQMLQKVEKLLTEKHPGIDKIQEITEFYDNDFHPDRLQAQLVSLHVNESIDSDLQSILSLLRSLNQTEREYYCEVVKLVKLILVMPATNALSERSFSALRRIKTWLRNGISQVRLNHCMTFHVHKIKTDSIVIEEIGNEFINRNNSRKHIFGQYVM